MSKKNLIRFNTIEAFRAGKISRREAAERLELSERQISRLAKSMREKGIGGLIHGNTTREPINQFPDYLVEAYLGVYQEKYREFNYRHALEMMALHEEIPQGVLVSYQTFRRWCRDAGIGKQKRRRPSKARIRRERASQRGMIVQLDGSHHLWYGLNKRCFMAMIDDATGELLAASFSREETTVDAMELLRSLIENHGVPEVIITDKAGFAGKGKRFGFTQFGRACEELGIILINTSVPESKGRIERLNRTAQDRLIPELKLYGICSDSDANRYLKQCFIPDFNERFGFEATNSGDRFKKLQSFLNLDEILRVHQVRIASRDNCVAYAGSRYRITTREHGSFWKKELTLQLDKSGGVVKIKFGSLTLPFEKVRLPTRAGKKWVA